MRKIIHTTLLAFSLCSFCELHAQVTQKYFGRLGRGQFAINSAILKGNRRAMVGYAYTGTSTSGSDALAMCLDTSDNVLWAKELGTANTDRFVNVTPTSDSGFVAVGFADVTGANTSPSALIVKFSQSGAVIWSKILKNTSNGEMFVGVTEMPTNGHILCSGAYNYSPATVGGLLVDMDASGTILWSKYYDLPGSDAMWSITPKGSDIIATGYWHTTLSLYDGYLLELDESNGNLKWARSFDYTSVLTGSTGQWPQTVQVVGNKIYTDLFNFDSYSNNQLQHNLVIFDTSGLNPVCLDYKYPGMNYANGMHSLVVPPSDIYLVQSPATTFFDPIFNTSLSTAVDAVVTKINSTTASGLTPIYSRKLSNQGEQHFSKMDLVNGKLFSFGGVVNDPSKQFGPSDVMELKIDSSFYTGASSCAANFTTPSFANPSVSLNSTFSFTTIGTITWPTPTTTLNSVSVNLLPSNPCSAPDTIVNKYAAVLNKLPCSNTYTVDTATGFNPGDTVLMIQMKGATIDTSNTSSFGTILNYNGAGNYEYNVIKSVSGTNITLLYNVHKTFDIPNGRVQFVRVPYYSNYTVNQPHTCVPWNGRKGGVLVLNASGTITLNAPIDVSRRGFRPGNVVNDLVAPCNQTNYYYPTSATNSSGAEKGEGIAEVSTNRDHGRGALGNGGGGGNSHNTGGGGGGNAGSGGKGGNETAIPACSPGLPVGGLGGVALTYSNTVNRVFMGGGSGAGHENNSDGGIGAYGGGIVFISANQLAGNGYFVNADGGNGQGCVGDCWDGQPGGAGGGAILLNVNSYTTGIVSSAIGGNGASFGNNNTVNGPCGPGGGGGGGAIWLKGASVPAQVATNVSGGAKGLFLNNNSPWGTSDGSAGSVLSGLLMPAINPADTYMVNIIVPNFQDSAITCTNRGFRSTTTTTTTGIRTWAWDFGDGGTSALQSPTHNYAVSSTYSVKLVVTDSNGCRDSVVKPVGAFCTDTVINRYAAVLSLGLCNNVYTVDTATGFASGDTILIIQMKGATIDTSNTSSFGSITAYNNAGLYEYNVIQNVSGNNITLRFNTRRNYNIPAGKVQFVKAPSFTNYSVTRGITAMPWNGSKGGVVVIRVTNTLTLGADINVSGKGFRGGQPLNSTAVSCNKTDYFYSATNDGARKGEGVAELSNNQAFGRGAQANGGGGGNASNSGGGGGSNYSNGGGGGNQSVIGTCATTPNIGGVGGYALSSSPFSRAFMGGGGGAGHGDDNAEKAGGNGGGIIFITASTIVGNNHALIANGDTASECTSPGSPGGPCADDAGGGGGGGGLIYSTATSITGLLTVQARGGKGSNVYVINDPQVGPGGGGSGGAWAYIPGSFGGNVTFNGTGGAAGVLPQFANSTYGAQAGSNGQSYSSTAIPMSNVVFNGNVLNLAFSDSATSCFDRKLINGSTSISSAPLTYNWFFPNGSTSTQQNPSYTFPGYGKYLVTLTIIDSNGCSSSLAKYVDIAYRHFAQGFGDTTICNAKPVMLSASGGISYTWTPATGVVAPNSSSTLAYPTRSTTYKVSVIDSIGCVDSDLVVISIAPSANHVVATPVDTNVCLGDKIQLHASGTATYQWSPPFGLDDPNSASPTATVQGDVVYVVTGIDTAGCQSFDTVSIHYRELPVVDATSEGIGSKCQDKSVLLKATGNAISYTWAPANYVVSSNGNIAYAKPPVTTLFMVTGIGTNGCRGTDTVTAFVSDETVVGMPDAFSPNADGRNDFIHPMIFCDFTLDEYRIYDRWGQEVFVSGNASSGWNGYRSGGQQADVGTYHYIITGKRISNGEKVVEKGTFILMR
jgi:gliding motility-associated-like protein